MDYSVLEKQAAELVADERNFIANAANIAALLYNEMPDVNWAGFYFADEAGLVLGPFCGRPACVRLPAGRGVCGAAVREQRTVIVDDVDAFADHIVCDTASQSEIAVPLQYDGDIIGVLDVDSPRKGRFTAAGASALEKIASVLVSASSLEPFHFLTKQRSAASTR